MSGMQIRAWRSLGNNKTRNIAVGVTNQTLAIPDTPFGTRALRIVNVGTQTVFVELGLSTVVADVTTSIPILPGSAEVMTIPNDITTIATIAAATGSTLYFTYGEGL